MSRKCPQGCTCKRHDRTIRQQISDKQRGSTKKKCPEGCECGRHTRSGTHTKCEPDCTCWRHNRSHEHRLHLSESRQPKDWIVRGGYKILFRQFTGHPCESPFGQVKEHRKVLYDKIGPGMHNCHWCGCEIEWFHPDKNRGLRVDHLNRDRLDNRPENLVESCNLCNFNRTRLPEKIEGQKSVKVYNARR